MELISDDVRSLEVSFNGNGNFVFETDNSISKEPKEEEGEE